MGSPQTLPPAMVEFACAFEAYRRLGFSADDIFCSYQRGRVFATLRTQGKEFNIACGPVTAGPEETKAIYERLAEEVSDWSDADFAAAWQRSFVGRYGLALISGLQARGFELPKVGR